MRGAVGLPRASGIGANFIYCAGTSTVERGKQVAGRIGLTYLIYLSRGFPRPLIPVGETS